MSLVSRHDKQLLEHNPFGGTDILRRSALGRIPVWNALPQNLVDLSLKMFQRKLQVTLLSMAKSDPESPWRTFLRTGLQFSNVRRFQSQFVL